MCVCVFVCVCVCVFVCVCVRVLFALPLIFSSHSHIINFGHAMFDDLYGAFKGDVWCVICDLRCVTCDI